MSYCFLNEQDMHLNHPRVWEIILFYAWLAFNLKYGKKTFLEKYNKFVQGISFLILRLDWKSAPGSCSFHYYPTPVLYNNINSQGNKKNTHHTWFYHTETHQHNHHRLNHLHTLLHICLCHHFIVYHLQSLLCHILLWFTEHVIYSIYVKWLAEKRPSL